MGGGSRGGGEGGARGHVARVIMDGLSSLTPPANQPAARAHTHCLPPWPSLAPAHRPTCPPPGCPPPPSLPLSCVPPHPCPAALRPAASSTGMPLRRQATPGRTAASPRRGSRRWGSRPVWLGADPGGRGGTVGISVHAYHMIGAAAEGAGTGGGAGRRWPASQPASCAARASKALVLPVYSTPAISVFLGAVRWSGRLPYHYPALRLRDGLPPPGACLRAGGVD